jgi:putative permease
MNIVRTWFRRFFSDPQVVVLALLLIAGVVGIALFGHTLAPVIASLVIAYVLDAPVQTLVSRRVPHLAAVAAVFVGVFFLILFSLLTFLPLLTRQLAQLIALLPKMVTRVQELLLELPERYPELIDANRLVEITNAIQVQLLGLGQNALRYSVDSIQNLFTIVVYLFLVPMLVFFFLKDKERIKAWFARLMPSDRRLAQRIWKEVDQKTGAYVRGKCYEIAIVGVVSTLVFYVLGLDFAMLLGVLTGLSVVIPYIGVAAVFVPVTGVAFFQFGITGEFAAVVGAYTVIQLIDGNLLAPLLISEVVDLHPIAVIVAILIFGGIWGFWGVFFAIPLATLADALLNAWMRRRERAPGTEGEPPASAGAEAETAE